MKTDLFQSCGHCWVFQICWHIECSTFRNWNSWAGIPSPPLALFVVMISQAHVTSHSRMSGSRWVIIPSWLSWSWECLILAAYFLHLEASGLPAYYPLTSIRVFSSESVLHIRWPKYWSYSFSISPSNEYSGLVSFRINWLDILADQGALKSLLQHHSSSHSITFTSFVPSDAS